MNFALEIYKAFDDKRASNSIEVVIKTLTELYNFFEPEYFDGKFFVLNDLDNNTILSKDKRKLITFNKEQLINQKDDFVIQIIDNNLYLSEDFNESDFIERENLLIYNFENNREFFIANKTKIEITDQAFGSRFSSEFWELNRFLKKYTLERIRNSSCPIFIKSWFDEKRIFFLGGGKNIPEKFMQESLKYFIDNIRIFKGEIGQFEEDREHNLNAERPVDLLIKWEKSNRIALVEIKWLGKSKNTEGEITTEYYNKQATDGYVQLKEYYELAKKDYPTKIIKCFLVVIDGRRWQTSSSTQTISRENGMHYDNSCLEIDTDKKYWETYPNFEEPIRMFTEPICEM